MQWTTIGRNHYPGYLHLMQVSGSVELAEHPPLGNRYQLILAEEGEGALQLGRQLHSVASPSIICLNEADAFLPLQKNRIIARSLAFNPQTVNRKYDFPMDFGEGEHDELTETDRQDLWCMIPFKDRSCSIPVDPMYARHISGIMNDIREQLAEQPDDGWPCRSRSYMLELLSLVRRLYDRSEAVPHTACCFSNEGVEPILRFLHTHYREKIKVEDITRAFHTNKTTLNQRFKQCTGLTVMSYLNSIRMQMAGSMLRNTTLAASEIMVMVGIQDSAHFIRNFRKYSGYSPSEYRTRFCWMLK
ncbi:Bifunctional transcriptional activator/DNA repair enzyme AdaA [compost metagenome]